MKGESLLFGCCSGFQSISNEEATDYTFIKSSNARGKKIKLSSLPHSPKSSLRILSSFKKLNNSQNVSGLSSLNLAQTVDHNWRSEPKKQNIVVQQYVSHLPVIKPVTFQRQQLVRPLLHPPQSNALLNANKKHNLSLVPSNQNGKSQFVDTFSVENKHQIPQAIKDSEKFEDKQVMQRMSITPDCQKQVKKISTKKTSNDRKDSIQSVLSLGLSELELGGSKTTFLSQGEIENSIHLDGTKMQQSQILINVFNPSNSQIQKWNVPTISQSHH